MSLSCTGAIRLGLMATLFLGINLASASATWIICLALLTYMDLPEDAYLAFPIARRKHVYNIQNHDLGGWIDVYCCIPNPRPSQIYIDVRKMRDQ